MDDTGEVFFGVDEFADDIVGLGWLLEFGLCGMGVGSRERTLSHPSNAHRPAYSATAQFERFVLVSSNQLFVFQSSLGCPFQVNPVVATTMPVIVTPSNAMNLKNINKSPILVPSFVDIQFSIVTVASPASATPLLTQVLTFSTSAPTTALTTYSPKIIDIIAALPGFKTQTALHVNKNPINSPNILDRYTCAPPFNGIAPPSSA